MGDAETEAWLCASDATAGRGDMLFTMLVTVAEFGSDLLRLRTGGSLRAAT